MHDRARSFSVCKRLRLRKGSSRRLAGANSRIPTLTYTSDSGWWTPRRARARGWNDLRPAGWVGRKPRGLRSEPAEDRVASRVAKRRVSAVGIEVRSHPRTVDTRGDEPVFLGVAGQNRAAGVYAANRAGGEAKRVASGKLEASTADRQRCRQRR